MTTDRADRPVASVIVPVMNGERFLAQALGSIAAQDIEEPFETIVVDDGSTDRSGEIARSFPSVRLHRQANQGVAAARNAGIAMARGEYVAFLDQDDLFTADKLRVQLAFMRERPEVRVTYARQRFVLEEGRAPPRWFRTELLAADHVGLVPSALVARAGVFDEVGLFDPSYVAGSDADWFARVRRLGVPLAFVPRTLLLKRIHEANESARTGVAIPELCRVVRTHMDARRSSARAGGAGAGAGGDGGGGAEARRVRGHVSGEPRGTRVPVLVLTAPRSRDYLGATLDSLRASGYLAPPGVAPVQVVLGSPESGPIARYEMAGSEVRVRSMPPELALEARSGGLDARQRCSLGHCSWMRVACEDCEDCEEGRRPEYVLACEDDIVFSRGWAGYLEGVLRDVEAQGPAPAIVCLYRPFLPGRTRDRTRDRFERGERWFPFSDHFWGLQAVVYPTRILKDLADYVYENTIVAYRDPVDIVIGRFAWSRGIRTIATAPSLVDHVGQETTVESQFHKADYFVESVEGL